MTSRTWPKASSTNSSPGFVVADVPSAVGRLPTITHPERKATSAVVSPTPPRTELAGIVANSFCWPPGETSTIVVPRPCSPPGAAAVGALLKLLTRTSPAVRSPRDRGMTATPYGLTSPFAGTVLATVETPCRPPMKEPPALVPAAAGSTPAAAAAAATEINPATRFPINTVPIPYLLGLRQRMRSHAPAPRGRPVTRRSSPVRHSAPRGLAVAELYGTGASTKHHRGLGTGDRYRLASRA